jgi:hypothetical protein
MPPSNSLRLARVVPVVALAASALLPSALCRAQGSGVIVITEVMYHPQGGGQDLEFIEILNATTSPIDLSGWYFSKGINFTFPDGTFLNGGQYLVICANQQRIREAYEIQNTIGDWARCSTSGESTGCALDNGGEAIELSEESGIVHCRVRYNDRGKWPAGADGTGHSLEMRSPYLPQDDPQSWAMSARPGGSPGKANDTTTGSLPVIINEGLLLTTGERWIELFNTSDAPVDLSKFYVTTQRTNLYAAQLAEETVIAPRGWLVLKDTDLGLDFTPASAGEGSPARTFVALSAADRSRVIDAYSFEPVTPEKSEARIPDGDEDTSAHAEPTPGGPNRVVVETDVVINEILYHAIDRNPSAEFVELFNRGTRTIDLSGWRFTNGINFDIPPGTRMAPGSYLVIGRDPPYLQEVYGLSSAQVLGPDPNDEQAVRRFGRFANGGERITLRDASGNVADTVRYHDGGQWPRWADGGGSSLELIDPFQDNNVAAAWDASNDSHKAPIQEIEYEGMYLTGEPEFHLSLNAPGITLVDDIRMFQRQVVLEVAQTLIGTNEEWRYFKGTEEASEPRDLWRQPGFDDSSWLTGATNIGFGDGDEVTLLDDMRNNYMSYFCRKRFQVTDPDAIGVGDLRLVLEVEYDDGFIAYLNGTRVAVGNMRETEGVIEDAFDARARSSVEKKLDRNDITEFRHLLVRGENVLAVQVHNATLASADARFIPRLVTGRFVNVDGPNVIPNGDFEEPMTVNRIQPGAWLVEGTHINSGQTTAGALSGKASFKVVATGKGDNKVNRLEQTLGALPVNSLFIVSFKARWVVGSQTILSRGHNRSNNLDYARSSDLGVPRNLGTPGAVNSATLRRIAMTGSFNAGPVIDKVRQTPVLPRIDVPVQVEARVQDSDGVGLVKLVYWLEDVRGLPGPNAVEEIAMGGPDARGFYRATIPGQALRTRVVYHIVASDTGGRLGRYPADQLERVHPLVLDPSNPPPTARNYLIYRHDNPVSGANLQSYRFWLTQANESYMSSRKLHSNDMVEGSFIFGNTDLYYNARMRFSGSPWARGGWGESFRVALSKDGPLHGGIKKFNMEDHQGGGARDGRERISNYLIRHNQGNSRVPYSFQWLVQWQANDRVNEVREHVQTPNREFIQYWFPGDDDGSFFEMDDRHEFNDGGTRADSRDGYLRYPPYPSTLPGAAEDKEQYRWYFSLRMNEGADDFSHLIAFAKVMTPGITSDAEFDRLIWEYCDVEQFLRCWAIRLNTDDWDTWGTRRGKNCYLYRPAIEGRWKLLPWDMELTYGDTNAFAPTPITQIYNTGIIFPEVVRMLNRPRIKRLYYGIMNEMVNHQFDSTFLTPYMQRLAAVGVQSTNVGMRGGYIDARRNLLRSRLQGATSQQLKMSITTNGGQPFDTQSPVTRIEGRAGVDVMSIVTIINEQEPGVPVEVRFSDSDVFGWGAEVPLCPGANNIMFLGFNGRGGLADMASITVTATIEQPAITAVEPSRVAPGEIVVLSGRGFHAGLTVEFQGIPAAALDHSQLPDRIIALVPKNLPAGMVSVVVSCRPAGQVSAPYMIEIIEAEGAIFLRGDVDADGRITVNDAVHGLLHLFRGRPLACAKAADTDDDGNLTLSDMVRLLNFLFQRGAPPAAPFPKAGPDPTPDALGCQSAPG